MPSAPLWLSLEHLRFGMLYCTATSLLLLLAIYLIIEDMKSAWERRGGVGREA